MTDILVIDDDDFQRAAIVHVLSARGYSVVEAATGQAALSALRAAPATLIITDILMPDMDGIELIRLLRNSHPATKIMAISSGGWSDPEQFLSMAQRLGANSTLAKPFTWDDLLGNVSQLIGTRAAASA